MVTQIAPVKSTEEISNIAFGFMASKALFAGLHIGIFTILNKSAKTPNEIAEITKTPISGSDLFRAGVSSGDGAARYYKSSNL